MILQLIGNRNAQTIQHWLLLWKNIKIAWNDSSGINELFVNESLLANLQHHTHNTSFSSENQTAVKKRKENIDFLYAEVDDSFESIKEITESIENSKEDF